MDDRWVRIRNERIAWISSICDPAGDTSRSPRLILLPEFVRRVKNVRWKLRPRGMWNSKDKQEHNFWTGDVTQPTANHGSLCVPRRS